MSVSDEVAKTVAGWFVAADGLEQWRRTQAASCGVAGSADRMGDSLRRMRDVLHSLARGDAAIPAETPGEPQAGAGAARELESGWNRHRRDARPLGFNEIRLRRDAVLRLGVWHVLQKLHEHARATGRNGQALTDLQCWLGSGVADVPPGVGPSLPYAGSPSALAFFNGQLRAALQLLAERYDPAGADFGSLARTEPFDDTGVAVSRWSRAWTVAVTAVYLDLLTHRSAGRLDRSLVDLWGTETGTVRFKAPAGLKVLPTRERSMHMDLWTGIVHAQVLAHDNARWQRDAAAGPWHRVRIAMHDLGEKDEPRPGAGGVRTVYRGLGVEMLYQTVFIDCAGAMLQLQREHEPAMKAADRSAEVQTIVVEVEAPNAGQQPNVQLVLRWKDRPAPGAAARFSGALVEPRLNLRQRQALAAWRWRRPGPAAQPLDAMLVDWCPSSPADRFADECGVVLNALGHAALWQAVSPACEWMELALRFRLDNSWHSRPVCVHEQSMGGELRSWLLLAPAEPGSPMPDPAALASALQSTARSFWSAHHAGLGVFLMVAVDLDPDDRD